MITIGVVLLGLLAIVIVFVVVGVSAMSSQSTPGQMDVLAGAIARGDVPGLAPFAPSLFSWMAKDLEGHASSRMPFGGAVTGSLAATVLSCAGPGQGHTTLLALRTEIAPREGRGRIDVLAGGVRVELALHQLSPHQLSPHQLSPHQLSPHQGAWFVTAQGRPLGVIDPASGRVDDAARATIGAIQRLPGVSHLHLYGGHVASIDGGATLHPSGPPSLRPLVRLAAELPPGDAALWLLAVIGLELGLALTPVRGRGSSTGVP